MKKTMILALAILGMVLGSLGTTQQARAAEDCEFVGSDQYDCETYLCPSGCVIVVCPEQEASLECE